MTEIWNMTPIVLKSGNGIFDLDRSFYKKSDAEKRSIRIKRDGYRVYTKFLNINGRDTYLIYKSSKKRNRIKNIPIDII